MGLVQLGLCERGRLARLSLGIVAVACWVLLLGGRSVSEAAAPQREDFVVIAHPGTVPKGLDLDALQQVFLRQRLIWPGGVRIVPFNYPAGDAVRVSFDRAVLGMTPERSAAYWIDARIRFGLDAPRAVPSARLAVNITSRLPGSIAYIPKTDATAQVFVVAKVEGGRVLPP